MMNVFKIIRWLLVNLTLKKSNSVMELDGLDYGVLGTPPNSVNTVKRRLEYIQLSLFDCTYNGTRHENPTRF